LTIKCQYLNSQNCEAISENDEAKEARKIGCANDNQKACCYQCDFQRKCDISCSFLGKKAGVDGDKPNSEQKIVRCSLCQTKMLNADMNLRVGGWSGVKQWMVPLGQLSELGQELLPVTVFACPKCGKMDFIAKEKTLQRIVNQSLLEKETATQ
jgi:hypothetical protein